MAHDTIQLIDKQLINKEHVTPLKETGVEKLSVYVGWLQKEGLFPAFSTRDLEKMHPKYLKGKNESIDSAESKKENT